MKDFKDVFTITTHDKVSRCIKASSMDLPIRKPCYLLDTRWDVFIPNRWTMYFSRTKDARGLEKRYILVLPRITLILLWKFEKRDNSSSLFGTFSSGDELPPVNAGSILSPREKVTEPRGQPVFKRSKELRKRRSSWNNSTISPSDRSVNRSTNKTH